MAEDFIRVLRVIEYTGVRHRVEEAIAKSIHGTKDAGNGLVIKAATIGAYPEILEREQGRHKEPPDWIANHQAEEQRDRIAHDLQEAAQELESEQ